MYICICIPINDDLYFGFLHLTSYGGDLEKKKIANFFEADEIHTYTYTYTHIHMYVGNPPSFAEINH